METKIKTRILHRRAKLESVADDEKQLVVASISSEEPYRREFGWEILSHDEKAVNLDRVQRGAVPFLKDHHHTQFIGKVKDVRLENGRAYATIQMGGTDLARETFKEIQTGTRTEVSIGYQIDSMEPVEGREEETFLATSWSLLEVSSVAVPADSTVGFGRSINTNHRTVVTERNNKMETKEKTNKSEKRNQNDVEELLAMADVAGISAGEVRKAINEGVTVDDFRKRCFEKMTDPHAQPAVPFNFLAPDSSERASDKFSITRLIASQIPGSNVDAGAENEVSKEVRKTYNRDFRGSAVPMGSLQERTLTVGTDSAGGYTVATDLLTGNFIELLRNKSMVMEMNPTVLNNLVGDIAIPKQDSTSSVYYLAEGDSVTNSDATFGQVTLSPTTIAARTSYSRMALLQSSVGIEQFVRNDLATALAIGVDAACISGTGADAQPLGILNTSGIGSVAGGTNGLAPTYAHIVGLETDVANSNADVGSLSYLTNSKVRATLKQVFTNATYGENPLWTPGKKEGFGSLNGYRAGVSNNVPSNLTKGSSSGVCSAIIFGNWQDLIVGFWGGLDIVVDPFTNSSTGQVNVTAFLSFNLGVKHAASFSAMQDALTT